MNRFLLFTGLTYYPCGGWSDFANSFVVLQEAFDEVERIRAIQAYGDGWQNWWQIVDFQLGKIVSEGSFQ